MGANYGVKDDDSLILKLDAITELPKIIDIETELQPTVDIRFILGDYRRWIDIQERYNRPIRLYAHCSNLDVEKYVVGLVNRNSNMYISILPGKEVFHDCAQ